jgi:hypothetical protein
MATIPGNDLMINAVGGNAGEGMGTDPVSLSGQALNRPSPGSLRKNGTADDLRVGARSVEPDG